MIDNMICYRIAKSAFDKNDLIAGIQNQEDIESITKFENAIKHHHPNQDKVPYSKGMFYAFLSLDDIKTFLFKYAKMSDYDISELESLGYKLIKLELDVWSCGLSKVYLTFFENECISSEDIKLSECFL